MGHKNATTATKSARGVNISTVGVDVAEWTYEPKRTSTKDKFNYGPVTFRTWDFGGRNNL
jgi:hypothetical protein